MLSQQERLMMLLGSGSCISQHLRVCDHRRGLGLGLGLCSRTLQLSYFNVKPPSGPFVALTRRFQQISSSSTASRFPFGCLQSKSPHEIPSPSDSFSQQEDGYELPSEGLSPVTGGIVALGKFDALHIGHRELAIQASKIGAPFLLSFVGMAEVLGWEPRAPIVAKYDRKRVLSSWAPYCGNVTPAEFEVEFSSVRHLTPLQFVEKLSKELGVCGVVAGQNYRFGYKAAGDASELVRLCEEFGLGAYIINSVMDKNQDSRNIDSCDSKDRGQVSSTRVRHALAEGDMKYVSELLGRHHRLILLMKDKDGFTSSIHRISAPMSCLLNLPPKDGFYENSSLLIGDKIVVPCRVIIDTTHIHLELDEVDACVPIASQEFKLLGVEFGDLGG